MLLAAAIALAGCSSDMFTKDAGEKWFSAPLDVFAKRDWASISSPAKDKNALRPVGAEDFIDASGRCVGAAEPGEGAVAGDPANAAPAAGPLPGFGTVAPTGGVALTMTECEVVRRAGQAENVEIGANESGERKTVLTYLRGSSPGIYRFTAGRLNEIERAPGPPEPPKPPKPPPKKKKPAKPKTAAG